MGARYTDTRKVSTGQSGFLFYQSMSTLLSIRVLTYLSDDKSVYMACKKTDIFKHPEFSTPFKFPKPRPTEVWARGESQFIEGLRVLKAKYIDRDLSYLKSRWLP